MGRFAADNYSCLQEIDSILVTTSSNKVVIKDILDLNNWTKESKGGRNAREDCTFIINDEDLQ